MELLSLFEKAIFSAMLDNKKRGRRALFWMKVFFFVVLFIMIVTFYVSHGNNVEFVNDGGFYVSTLMMSGIVLLPVALMLLVFCSVLHLVFWLAWLFRAEENLRKVTKPSFSPWGSVILSLIPYIGLPIHYFIFRDMVLKMEKILERRGVLPNGSDKSIENDEKALKPCIERVPMKFVNAFVVCTVLSSIFIYLWKDAGAYIGCVLGLVALACYIRALSVYVQEERVLFNLCEEDALRAKVDQVLREREIEKAASELHQAKYEP